MPSTACESKPWDVTRRAPAPNTYPIGVGSWTTTERAARVNVVQIRRENSDVLLSVGTGINPTQWFDADCLRQLAEFCTELADQLDNE